MLHMDSHRPSERKCPVWQESHDRASLPAGSTETGSLGGRTIRQNPNAWFHHEVRDVLVGLVLVPAERTVTTSDV